MNQPNENDHPILCSLIKQGIVWIDGYEIVGCAKDDVFVILGTTEFLDATEAYLTQSPLPENW